MKAPVSWIKEYVDLPDSVTTEQLTDRLTALGLKLEAIHTSGAGIEGPLVVGQVLTQTQEPQKNGKTINWCTVDVGDANGTGEPQGIVCGAHNFGPGDKVVVILPGGVLPGDFHIAARKTYGHVSAGMICSARELGLGEDHDGIIVLPPDAPAPGTDAREVLGLGEEVIEFEINPDRAYALSLRGVAREAALGFEAPFHDPAQREFPLANDAGYPVVLEDDACPYFVARTVTGFDPSRPTPEFMARRLEQCGMRSISLAVDISNYVMLELGQPNHCYDKAKLSGPIRVRRATAGEKLTTLDDVTRTLTEEDLLIADDSGPIGLAGVMGGAATEISESTTDIVVEAAWFDPTTIFRGQKRHKLGSEASKRFERGVDPLLAPAAAQRVVDLMVEYGGATAAEGVTEAGTRAKPGSVSMPVDLPRRISGIPSIDDATTVRSLELIGARVTVEGDTLTATVPTYRPDLSDPYDLVEEVVRIVGYDQVPSVLPREAAGRGLTREQRLRRRVGRTLAGAGLVEVISFPFVGRDAFDRLGLAEDDPRRHTVELANPLSSEAPSYTTTVLPGLLEAAGRNLGRGAAGVALFETQSVALPVDRQAPIFGVDRRPTDDELAQLLEAIPLQWTELGVVLAGERERGGWWGPAVPAGWQDAIATARRLAEELGVQVATEAAAVMPWHPGRCARITTGETTLGFAGELHPKVCKAYGLPERSAAVVLDLDSLIAAAPAVVRGPSFSTFPVAKEDVALVVDDTVSSAQVETALREGAGPLLESVRLFDVYVGEQLGAGKKSLAFALRFRAPDRTLEEGEAGAARDAAVARAAEVTGAVQRS